MKNYKKYFLFLIFFTFVLINFTKASEVQDGYLTLNNLKIYYQHSGKGKNLILIHGFAASTFSYRKNIDFLAKYFSVYALDLVGFGKSDKPINYNYSLKSYAKLVIDFMNELKIKNAVLAGNSMGGAVSLRVALDYADRIEKIILFDSAGADDLSKVLSFDSIFENLSEQDLKKNILSILKSKKILTEIMKMVIYDDSQLEDEDIDGYLKPLMTEDFANVLIALFKADTHIDLHNELAKIKQPTLIIWGEDDLIIPVKNAQTFKDLIPNSQMVILKNCGHIPMEEKADEVNKLVYEFLK